MVSSTAQISPDPHPRHSTGEEACLETERVSAAKNGDGLAYRRLVEPHLDLLFRLAMRDCGDVALAEDAVQETLTIAYKSISKFEHRSTFRSYLAAILLKRVHSIRRGEKRRKWRQEQAVAMASRNMAAPDRTSVSGDDPEHQIRMGELRKEIELALNQLRKKHRQVVVLRLDAELSFDEIGAAMRMTAGAARVLYHRAIQSLRKLLNTEELI